MSEPAQDAARLELQWRFGEHLGGEDAARLLALLRGIAASGSIAAAAREQASSYRHAWGRIERWQEHFGRPLVSAGRGSGSRLTAFAQKLLELDQRTRTRLAPQLAAARQELAALLAPPPQTAAAPLAIVASHDLALAELAELLRSRGVPVDLHFRGSLEALRALAQGQCAAAGFHCPGGDLGRRLWAQYRPHLSPRKHRLMRLWGRRQGLMVRKGNPKRIRTLEHLSRGGVRFLNRQPGAGTRLLLDHLLAQQGLSPAAIQGYTAEENTHAAVAALIAGDAADCALGIEAAARRFGLGFVPLLTETYYLALTLGSAGSAAQQAFMDALADSEFRRRAAALPGYDLRQAGAALTVSELEQSLAAAG